MPILREIRTCKTTTNYKKQENMIEYVMQILNTKHIHHIVMLLNVP